jgi:hypothetical protein
MINQLMLTINTSMIVIKTMQTPVLFLAAPHHITHPLRIPSKTKPPRVFIPFQSNLDHAALLHRVLAMTQQAPVPFIAIGVSA